MKSVFVLLIATFSLLTFNLKAQDSCITAFPFCTGSVYDWDSPTGIAAPSGPDYGCLGSVANPIWFSFQVTTAGPITITGSGLDFATTPAPIDIDFIYWGPYTSLTGVCYTQLDASHIAGCDYSGSNLINISIPSAVAGNFYIAMISNYSDDPGNINYSQTGGLGAANCGSACTFNTLTTFPTVCDSIDNTYDVTGSINFLYPPTTGILTIFGSCGGSQTFTAPFISPINYSLNNLSSNGASCVVAAAFSDDGSCSINKFYAAPATCNFTSVGDFSTDLGLTISPNPSNGLFELNYNSNDQYGTISITDIAGRNVYTEKVFKVAGSYKKQIDLSSIKKGFYFVAVEGESGSAVKKIILN